MRSFIALEVPDELRKKIATLQQQLAGLDVKLVDQQNLHFTLKFLGDVQEPALQAEPPRGLVTPGPSLHVQGVAQHGAHAGHAHGAAHAPGRARGGKGMG